MKEHT